MHRGFPGGSDGKESARKAGDLVRKIPYSDSDRTLGSPIFPSGCEGKLGVALESLQGLRDLT